MADLALGTEKNIARLMVRRHLRSWLGSDILSEDLLIAMFIRDMKRFPDLSMTAVARGVDAEIRDLVAIVLGAPVPEGFAIESKDDRDDLGLDPG